MNRKILTALVGAVALALAATSAALAAGTGPAVTVQVKTPTKILLQPTSVHGESGWITKGKTPRGKCPGSSAAGALDAATHGHWRGKYFSGLGIEVTSIVGVKPKRNHFWEIFVNGKPASVGICGIKLHNGQRLLFKIAKF